MTSPTSVRLASGAFRGGVVLALALALGWAPTPAAAQATGTIVGTVRDAATQRPLEAVQVYIAGTGLGALSTAAGRFLLLNVPAGEHSLAAEIVGYRSGAQAVTVGAGQSVAVDFALEQTAIALDQIVVTGAGIATERRKLGNTIATVDATSLENTPITNFSQMIAGREPGVVSLPSSGYTGEGAQIRIRGSSSLSQLNEPIIYVDGIRVDRSAIESFNSQGSPSRLDDIPPESIERVEILKGAAAATLYGTEASNGVIQIFTKRGSAGAPQFTVQADWSAVNVPTGHWQPHADFAARDCEELDCSGVDDAATLAATQARIAERWGKNVGPYEVFEEELLPTLLGTGFGQNYSASVSGGSDSFQYFVSGRIISEDGAFDAAKNFEPVEDFEPETDSNRRASITTNFTVIPSQKIRIGVSTLYSDMEHHTPDNANNIYGVFPGAMHGQLRMADESNLYGNPAFATVRETMYQQNYVNSQHFAGSTNISFTPTEALRLDGTFGVDFTADDAVAFRPYGWNVDGFSGSEPLGSRTVSEDRSREVTLDLKGSWIANFGSSIENTFMAGGQGFLRTRQSAGGSGQDFPGPFLETLDALGDESSSEEWLRVTQVGGYLQDQVGLNDWVFVTLGARWDANSAFGEEFDAAFYPKASISIVPSQGLGWQNETFSTLRIRSAIGRSGLQPGAFDKFTTYQSQNSAVGAGIAPDNLGNEALKPEVSTEWELGAEMGLFNDRWSIDATYWNRTVSDALVDRQFPVTGGFVARQLDNIGELKAWGMELAAQGNVLQREGLSLNIFANAAYLKEEISDLGGAPPLKAGGSYTRYTNHLVEGFAPGSFFAAKFAEDLPIPLNILQPNADGSCVVPTEAEALAYFSVPRSPSDFKPLALGNVAGNLVFDDHNGTYASHNCGTGLYESYLGKPFPDWAGSFGFNLAFLNNFELASLFEYKLGIQHQDLTGEFRRSNPSIGRNTPEAARLDAIMRNPASSAQERLDAAIAWARNMEALDPVQGMNSVYDSDFIQWRELSLTYRLPGDLVEGWGLSTATVNLGARNLRLFMLGDYPGMDPEGNVNGRCNEGLDCNFLQGTEGWGIPIPRRFTLSTRVTF